MALLHSQPNLFETEESIENLTSPEESDWYSDHLRFEDELRLEREDEIAKRDAATDEYCFIHRLGEYASWNDNDLGDDY